MPMEQGASLIGAQLRAYLDRLRLGGIRDIPTNATKDNIVAENSLHCAERELIHSICPCGHRRNADLTGVSFFGWLLRFPMQKPNRVHLLLHLHNIRNCKTHFPIVARRTRSRERRDWRLQALSSSSQSTSHRAGSGACCPIACIRG